MGAGEYQVVHCLISDMCLRFIVTKYHHMTGGTQLCSNDDILYHPNINNNSLIVETTRCTPLCASSAYLNPLL